jgi:hypothetical protein
MANLRRNTEAAQRAAARRQREDEAPRLQTEVPNLESLRLEIDVRRETGVLSGGTHIRRVVVENAPALFFVPCADRDCQDGGHDLTREIMTALRKTQTRFEGQDACAGQVGPARCGNVLRYVGVATYRRST